MTRASRSVSRRRVTHGVAFALIVSIALSIIFYMLLSTLASGALEDPESAGYWFAYATYLAYTQGYGLSILATVFFAGALVISISRRLALVMSFSLLNVLFAWTSHLFKALSGPLYSGVNAIIAYQDVLFWKVLNLGPFTRDTQVVADLEGFVLLGLLTSLVVLSKRDEGTWRAFLLSLQIAALSLVILGAEIAVFEGDVFYLHVTDIQVALEFVPWFSNADLLLSGVAVLAVSSGLSHFQRFRVADGESTRVRN